MITINKSYLIKVKQELVDRVEDSPFIIPELLNQTMSLPKPSEYIIEFHKDKLERKVNRRKEMTRIFSSDVSDYMPLIWEYLEKEFLEFLKAFPEYAQLKG